MIKASNKFIQSINDGNSRYIARGNITLADGTALVIDNSKIWESGIKIEDSVSSSSSDFTIGAFVSTKLTLTLNNITDEYSSYDFNKAEIKTLGIGLDIDGTEEIYPQGQFWVDEPKYNGSLISLTCSDRARFFNKQFVAPIFPISLGELLEYCVIQCLGSSTYLATTTFNNSTYIVQTAPKVDNWTYADAVACIAQIAGSYAKFGKDGKLYIDWYGEGSNEINLDGGTYNTQTTPYSDGDEADGGDYTFSETTNYDGGTYKEMENYHVVYALKSMNISTDNCTITKIEVTEVTENQSDAGTGSYTLSQKIESSDTSRDNNYVIKISNNKLIEKGQASTVAKLIGDRIIGLTFRPMSFTSTYTPLIEAGDVAYMVDRKGNSYFTFVSSRSSTIGLETSITCAGKPESKQNQISYNDLSKAMAQIKDNFEYVKTAYQNAQENLMQIIAFAGGLYKTEIKQTDGSVIRYEHDKPLLADSKKVWKYTNDACAVTTTYTGNDLTTTWNSGVEASGDALFRHITAESITGFTLTGNKINNGNGTFTVDEAGNMHASSADITGTIHATDGDFVGSIKTGTSINCNNKFIVDSTGKMTATDGDFVGSIKTGTSINCNNKFIVDEAGNMTATDGTFTGAVTGSTIIGSHFQNKENNPSLYIENGVHTKGQLSNGIYSRASLNAGLLNIYASESDFENPYSGGNKILYAGVNDSKTSGILQLFDINGNDITSLVKNDYGAWLYLRNSNRNKSIDLAFDGSNRSYITVDLVNGHSPVLASDISMEHQYYLQWDGSKLNFIVDRTLVKSI